MQNTIQKTNRIVTAALQKAEIPDEIPASLKAEAANLSFALGMVAANITASSSSSFAEGSDELAVAALSVALTCQKEIDTFKALLKK